MEDVRSVHQKNSLHKYEKKLKELEIIEKEHIIETQRQESKKVPAGIATISGIEHNVICSDIYIANHIPSEYLHYKSIRDFTVL